MCTPGPSCHYMSTPDHRSPSVHLWLEILKLFFFLRKHHGYWLAKHDSLSRNTSNPQLTASYLLIMVVLLSLSTMLSFLVFSLSKEDSKRFILKPNTLSDGATIVIGWQHCICNNGGSAWRGSCRAVMGLSSRFHISLSYVL